MSFNLPGDHVTDRVVVTVRSSDGLSSVVVPRGCNLWVALRKLGILSGHNCTGLGTCGSCLVEIVEGGVAGVSLPSDRERKKLSELGASITMRLACMAVVQENVSVRIIYPNGRMTL